MRKIEIHFSPRPGSGTVRNVLERVKRRLHQPAREPGLPITITNDVSPRLYWASRRHGVRVSRWQSEGICQYAGLDSEYYFLLCSLLGLAEWRCLVQNPLLIEEDFMHHAPSRCLFSFRPSKPEYASLFDAPHLCGPCAEFYRCLGAETEILTILELLRTGAAEAHAV